MRENRLMTAQLGRPWCWWFEGAWLDDLKAGPFFHPAETGTEMEEAGTPGYLMAGWINHLCSPEAPPQTRLGARASISSPQARMRMVVRRTHPGMQERRHHEET